jgi:tetratricopeptide (TPR) repeat protein
MSILHQSLERLRRGKPRERVVSAAPLRLAGGGFGLCASSRGRSVSLASALLLGLAALLLAALSRESRWLEQDAGREIQGPSERTAPTPAKPSPRPLASPEPPSPGLPTPEPPRLGLTTQAAPAFSGADQPLDPADARSESLEAHFAAQARRNQALLDQERSVAKTYASGDKEAAHKELRGYLLRVGENSVAAARWKGYQALKDGRYAEAEAVYRGLLSKNADDADSAYNFLLALLRQNKKSEAASFHARYMRGHSLDERVGSLTPLFSK